MGRLWLKRGRGICPGLLMWRPCTRASSRLAWSQANNSQLRSKGSGVIPEEEQALRVCEPGWFVLCEESGSTYLWSNVPLVQPPTSTCKMKGKHETKKKEVNIK